ncbi:MAG: hypothetical protein QM743_10230 [Chitinophagaceae bacterium]
MFTELKEKLKQAQAELLQQIEEERKLRILSGDVIPLSTFNFQKGGYEKPQVQNSLRAVGVEPTKRVRFEIADLKDYLSDLSSNGNTDVDVHFGTIVENSVTYLTVMFAAAQIPLNDTNCYDQGDVNP